jgi:hypothetical protein
MYFHHKSTQETRNARDGKKLPKLSKGNNKNKNSRVTSYLVVKNEYLSLTISQMLTVYSIGESTQGNSA